MVNSEAVSSRWRSEFAGPRGEVRLTPSNLSLLASAEATYEADHPSENAVLTSINNLMEFAKNEKLPVPFQERALVLGRLILSKFGRSSMSNEFLTFFKSAPTPPQPSPLHKTISSLREGNVAHVLEGVMNKVESHPILRQNLTDIRKLEGANIAQLRSPYGVINVKVTEDIAFTLAWTRASQGGRVSWEYDRQGAPENFVAFGSGPYVSDALSASMPVGFAVHEGKEINTYLDRKKEAIVIINDGQLAVYNYKETPWGNLTERKGMERFLHFYQNQQTTVFQSHLLVHEGRARVGTNSSDDLGSRRILLTLYDNNAAMVYFESPVTLYEAAKILEKIPGIRSAVNLDTGLNNCGRMKLGDETINQGCVSGRGGGGRLSSPVVLTKPLAKAD